jgi:hypothetical protein
MVKLSSGQSLSVFNDRVRQLVETFDEMDNFDLDSANGESCLMYRELRAAYVDDVLEFITLVCNNHEELIKEVMALLRDH